MLRAVGIGDLHLDGKLAKHIPDFNEVVIQEVRTVLAKARRQGIKIAMLYGDLCERSNMSTDAHCKLLALFAEFPEILFILWKGNHDASSKEPGSPTSLDLLSFLAESKTIRNLRVVLHAPRTFFDSTDAPLHVVPWPLTETHSGMLNALHMEAQGAKWETGRDVTEGFKTQRLCVVGHIHTAQQVRNTYFSGTLYQTTFGEDAKKYFHDITWTGDISTSSIKLIPHAPKYTLRNAVVKSAAEYKAVCAEIEEQGATTLWKVFIHSAVVLPVNAFDRLPTVIKHSPYTTKAELRSLVHEELELDDLSSDSSRMTLKTALTSWMDKHVDDADLRARALKKLTNLTKQT